MEIHQKYSASNYTRNLVIMLVILQLITVTSILLLSRINTDKVLIENAYDSMAKTINQSVDHTRSFLKPAYSSNETLKLLANNGVIDFNNIETIEKIFFTELTSNKHFAGIYIANEMGDFIYMLRQDPKSFSAKVIKETYQTKIITNNAFERKVVFHWRKSNFTNSRTELVPNYSYNPKTRPWYKLASELKQTVWTEPYTFFTSKKRGITIATPFYDTNTEISGVIGIDIEVSQLSSFLSDIQNDDYIRIMDEKGNLIAESTNDNVLTDERINQLLQVENDQLKIQQGTFQENQHEYLFTQSLLKSRNKNQRKNTEPNWEIFSYAKTSPFLSEVRSIESRNIFIALLTLISSVLISVFIAKKTSKPIESWMNQASTDNLTQLYNRHFFFSTANKRYSEYIELPDHNLAVMMIDVDLFKRINDDYGHNIGDKVLRGISDSISSIIKPDDLLARFGGEEFILLTKVDSHRDAMQFAEKIREVIANLNINTDVGIINITISIGVSVTEKQLKLSFREFIDMADKALYHSKNNGRNNVSLAKDNEIHSNKDTIKAR